MRLPLTRRRGSDLDGAAWLSERLLLLVGRLGDDGHPQVVASNDGSGMDVKAWETSYTSAFGADATQRRRAIMVMFPAATPQSEISLDVRTGRRVARIGEVQLARATIDLETLLEEQLKPLEVAARRRVLSLIVDASKAEFARAASPSLARNMNLVRDALRPPLPARVTTTDDRLAMHVEGLLAVDDRSFWMRGWASDRIAPNAQVELVSPEGHRIAALEGAHRHPRPDVDQAFADALNLGSGAGTGAKHGFIRYFELPSPSLVPSGWIVELRDPGGDGVEDVAPPVATNLASVRRAIMTDIRDFASRQLGDELLREHAHPALTKLQERLRASTRVDAVTQYGKPAHSAEVSVVVPLYGRIDLMEHQLCQFIHDPHFREIDLIYVLDSPELGEQLAEAAAALHAMYELPLRTVVLSRSAGFSIANNLGASLARGRLLLLLNSDVVPDAPGWVRALAAFYDSTPQIGALGPKLLYEDGSLQHAGVYFEREPPASLWNNVHYFRGLQGDFEPANLTRRVPAVTGACLMIERALWEEFDGLRSAYVQGGCEDSDLCLRLMEAGRSNWYFPQVELHHLEYQSFPFEERRMAMTYNSWLQTHRWGNRIEQLMQDELFSAQT